MRPLIVTIAIVALYVQQSIGVLHAVFKIPYDIAGQPHGRVPLPAGLHFGAYILGMLMFFSIMGLFYCLIYKIARGRNWARITGLVLLLAGVWVFFVWAA